MLWKLEITLTSWKLWEKVPESLSEWNKKELHLHKMNDRILELKENEYYKRKGRESSFREDYLAVYTLFILFWVV